MSRTDLHTHPKTDELHVLFVPSLGNPEVRVIRRGLKPMQELVGGYIEYVASELLPELPCGCRLIMVVDEEGRLKGREQNPRASMISGRLIVGDVFLLGQGLVGSEVDFFSLPQSYTKWTPGKPWPLSAAQPWEDD